MKYLLTIALLSLFCLSSGSAAEFAGNAPVSPAARLLRVAREGVTVRETNGSRLAVVLGRDTLSSHPAARAAWTMKIAARW